MNSQTGRRPFAVWLLIFLQFLLGLQGLYGGVAFILAPDGSLLQMPVSHLKTSPFSSFLIPGLLLSVFLGLYPIAVAYGLWKRPSWRWPEWINPWKAFHWGWAASLATGAIALVWIVVQIQWVPLGFLHLFIAGWGILILLLTLIPVVRHDFQMGEYAAAGQRAQVQDPEGESQ